MGTIITQESSGGKRRYCNGSCHNAKQPKCVCICGGRYHGAARDGTLTQKVEEFQDAILEHLELEGETKNGRQLILL